MLEKKKSPYEEIKIMKQVCRGQVPNMLPLLDDFEDEKNFYIVTKFLPERDLNHYVQKHWRFTSMPEEIVKVILR